MIRILTLFSTLTSLLFVLLAIGGTAHVYAQEMLETIPIDQTTQPNVDYAKTESLGLLGAKDKGSFGNGLLQHTKRSELVALLKIVEQSKWVSMRPLVKNFLLTETDATALTGDVPITPGEDLLTLRLNALLRMGYNREAFKLYRKASENKLDEPTVRTGVYAMLLNRQKGLACLEIKTLSGQFKDIPLWTILNFYCEASLPGENSSRKDKKDDFSQYSILDAILESPDYVYEYDPKDFAALSMIERAALCAQGSISTKYITPQTIAKIPPEHISILLAQPSLSDLQKALLLGAAIDHAIEPPEAMTAFYKELLEKQKQEKKIEGQTTAPGPSTPTATDELLIIAQLYEETTENWLGTARAEKISRAIALAHKHSDKLMIPFLPVISKLDIEKDISLEDALDIVHLYLYTPQKISKTWINDLLKIDYSDQPQQEIAREKLLISLFLLYENDKSALKNKMYNNISTKPLRSGLIKDVRNIIENIDITPINSDKVRMKDINGFDLGKDKRYTMPPYHVLSTLKQASENQDISVSLLLSACILSKIDKQDMYIGTLGNIASALSNVGIKIAPRHIVAEALMQAGKGQKTKTEELLRR